MCTVNKTNIHCDNAISPNASGSQPGSALAACWSFCPSTQKSPFSWFIFFVLPVTITAPPTGLTYVLQHIHWICVESCISGHDSACMENFRSRFHVSTQNNTKKRLYPLSVVCSAIYWLSVLRTQDLHVCRYWAAVQSVKNYNSIISHKVTKYVSLFAEIINTLVAGL